MKISACIITKNEEKNIARSIASYKDIVDEIIVVDSESTDDTVKIAKSLGAAVYTRAWTNDFAAAKNYAIDRASGDWILFLDADEYFADGQHIVVKQTIEKLRGSEKEIIFSPRYELSESSDEVVGINYVERVFKNDGQIRYINKIHEYLDKKGEEPERHITDAFVIYHTGYNQKELDDKARRNLKHLAEQDSMQEESGYRYYKAECYFGLEEYEKCIEQLSLLFCLPEFQEKLYTVQNMFRAYIFQITAMLNHREKYSECEIAGYVKEAVGAFGTHPEIMQVKSAYLMAYCKEEEAAKALEEAFCLAHSYRSYYSNTFFSKLSGKYQTLAHFYQVRGETQKAIRAVLDAILAEKGRNDLLYFLFCLLRTEDTAVKREKIEGLFDIEDISNLGKLAGAAWASGNNDLFAEYLSILLEKQPMLELQHEILYRIYFLQKNYNGILDVVKHHEGERNYDIIGIAAELAAGKKIEQESFEDILEALRELMRAGECDTAEELVREALEENAAPVSGAKEKEALACLFEEFGRWECAGSLYQKAALTEDEEEEKAEKKETQEEEKGKSEKKKMHGKGIRYIRAGHMLYLAGDDQGALDILREALPFAPAGNHFPIEILRWIGQRNKKQNKELYQKARRLQAKYEVQYDMSYDKPLPFPGT